MLIGAHISISKGYENAVNEAISIGANTLQFFTRNPRGSAAKALDPNDTEKMKKRVNETHFGPLVAHAPYTLNPASDKENAKNFTKNIILDDLDRMAIAGAPYIVLHPGSHLGAGVEEGIKRIALILKEVTESKKDVMILLETMSGMGTEVGYKFEQLNDIINLTGKPDDFGICFDTCHVFAAGYDIVNDLDGVISEFDKILGLSKLKAVHLNDSKFGLGSMKDRHANLGEGKLGIETIKAVLTHPRLKDKPFLLETPGGIEAYKNEIAVAKTLVS